MTVLELVEAMGERLQRSGASFGHGTLQPFDEAAWLVLWRLGLPLDELEAVSARAVEPGQIAAVEQLVDERIRSRKPAAYLTGEAWLQGVPFHVDERVVVPRSLIAEVLCGDLVDPWLLRDPRRVLDLCTGSGALAVLAALHWPGCTVDATDVSADALAVAARNVERHALRGRIRLRRGDALQAADGRYDVVLCNPPYVTRAAMAALPPEYRAEPALALDGGDDGMDFVRRVLPEVAAHLEPHGVLVLEVGHERAHFEAAFPGLDPVWLDTSAGEEQVLLLTREALA